jgi:hypothetical protein
MTRDWYNNTNCKIVPLAVWGLKNFRQVLDFCCNSVLVYHTTELHFQNELNFSNTVIMIYVGFLKDIPYLCSFRLMIITPRQKKIHKINRRMLMYSYKQSAGNKMLNSI